MELANINCVASLFSLTSFCKRRRGTVGTNMQCVWDKPRKNPNPRRSLTLKWGKTRHNNLNLLLLRRTPSTQLYRFKDSEPTLRRSSKNFSGATDALFFLQTLLDKTFESDDGDEYNLILQTMAYACNNFDSLSIAKNFSKILFWNKNGKI